MNLPIIFMYSGQGSQYYQMGKNLFEQNKTFKHWLEQADRVCIDIMKTSVIEHLYDKKNTVNQPFKQLTLTYPAIFMVEFALTQVLLENNIHPTMTLGSSMGEFAAATAAGIIHFEEILPALIKQAELLEKFCPRGGMLAILNDPLSYQSENYLHDNSELAAINFSGHFVVASSNTKLAEIETQLKEKNIISQNLAVTHPFHSSMMEPAKLSVQEDIKKLPLKNAKIPMISCTQSSILNSITQEHFWNVIRMPIQFQKTIHSLEAKQPAIYIDLGPSGTLATFVKYNLKADSQSKYYSLLTPFGEDSKNLAVLLKQLNIS